MAESTAAEIPVFSQAPDRGIIRVALYARVSTVNNQDPEMQLAELGECPKKLWRV